MFLHLFRYRLLQLLRNKETLIWLFTFPLLLATMFHFGFGNMMKDDGSSFEPIPVAIVSDGSTTSALTDVIQSLSKDGDDQLMDSTWVPDAKAKILLSKKKVDGIIYVTATPTLTVNKKGINQTILSSFLSQYLQEHAVITQITQEKPDQVDAAAAQLFKETSFNKEITFAGKNVNCLVQYFYALIAMVCLFGCTLGLDSILSIQPHLSAIGARQTAAPVHRMKLILAYFSATIVTCYISILVLLFYLTCILHVNLGDEVPLILLNTLVGSTLGISLGALIGSIGKFGKTTKEGIVMAVSLSSSFLGGLMVNIMPSIIEDVCPVINQINPATLITDSFTALSLYDDLQRYQSNLIHMSIIAALFILGSYLMLRKKTY